jgi:hypothetical protein
MTTGQIVLLTSTIGMAISGYLFISHWLRTDGIARIIFLVYTANFLIYFLIRFINRLLKYTDCIDAKQASEITVVAGSLLLIPLAFTLLIELYYKFNDKDK